MTEDLQAVPVAANHGAQHDLALAGEAGAVAREDVFHEIAAAKDQAVGEVADATAREVGGREISAGTGPGC